MAWKMRLFVERKGESGWQAVCPPLPSSSKGRAKWGVYTPKDPIESLALVAADEKDRVPTEPPYWDFGVHPVAMQQLGAFYSYVFEGDEPEDIRFVEPFLEPCGAPTDVSPQVDKAIKASTSSPALKNSMTCAMWYTAGELYDEVAKRKRGYDVVADKRVVALQMELARLTKVFYPNVCECRTTCCWHRKDLVRAIVWFDETKKEG